MPKDYTPPTNYEDMDGNMKTFTYVDHDVKTKISAEVKETTAERKERERWMKQWLKEQIEEILQFPAASIASHPVYSELIIRTEEGFVWNKEKVIEYLTNNRSSFLPTLVWKNTVKMSNWHHPMWIEGDHEAIMRGDWKSLM